MAQAAELYKLEKEVRARMALNRAEADHKARALERRDARRAAKGRQQSREERYLCRSCEQLVPFILQGECDHCRQESFDFMCARDPAYFHEDRCFCEGCHPHYNRALT